jgi:hypothetical protein
VDLILGHPGIHGGDSVARLAHSDRLLLAYQLPLPQALVYVTRGLLPDPFWTRLLFAAVGALAAAAVGGAIWLLAGERAAVASGLLLALHPMFVYYSLVPYQEAATVLFLALAAGARLCARPRWAALFLGMACLCRYEAWIAAGLFALHDRRRPTQALLHLWAPALWMLAWGGLSPGGTYVLDLDPEAARLPRLWFLLGKLREYTGTPVLVLAALGAAWIGRRGDSRWAWGLAFAGLVVLAVVLAGHEFPPGSGIVSEREVHVPAAAVCVLAGAAFGWLPAGWRGAVPAAAALIFVGLRWMGQAQSHVAMAGQDPSLRLAVSVARVAHGELPPGAHLGVVAPAVSAQALEDYVRKVGQAGGDTRRAREVATRLADRSPDADRVAAHLPRHPGTVLTRGPDVPALVAVFEDAGVPSPWPLGPPVHRAQSGGRAVTVFRTDPTALPVR